MRFISTLLALLVLLATNSSAWADWTLDNAGSQLSFVTVKAQDVAEVHTFSELSGAVGADGRARVLIQLASVDTLIPIRDERMRDVLFNTELFPTAAAVAQLDMRKLQAWRQAPAWW